MYEHLVLNWTDHYTNLSQLLRTFEVLVSNAKALDP